MHGAYTAMQLHPSEKRRYCSERIRKLPNPFTAKQVYDKGWHLLKNRKEVEAACDVLAGEDWLSVDSPAPTGAAGRPAMPRYSINPVLLGEK